MLEKTFQRRRGPRRDFELLELEPRIGTGVGILKSEINARRRG